MKKNQLKIQPIKYIMLKNAEGGIVRLTQMESECLSAFLKNKTCKERALDLKISHRTVELHMQNIKQQLKINYKNQLFDLVKSILIL